MEKRPELIRRSEMPEALEFPLEALDGPITPNELFFVRSHFETPNLEAVSWRVAVEGCVDRPVEFGLEELREMPKVSVEAVLECAGNGRSALQPPVPGLQWDHGAVGNAVWSGVSVRNILDLAGLADRTVDVVFQGADRGSIASREAPSGDVAYARSIPKDIALSENTILAYEMNGAPLSPSHGFPARLIVPGWYGAASVKWVTRILAIDHPFGGYYQTADYTYWELNDGLPERKPIGAMPVKSVIARPAAGANVRFGERIEICGAAWTGVGGVACVEVSLDGGATWASAKLGELRSPGSWRLWSFEWQATGPTGSRTILSRATDTHGRTQPARRTPTCQSYIIDHSIPIEINVHSM